MLVFLVLLMTLQQISSLSPDEDQPSARRESVDEEFIGWHGENFDPNETFGDTKGWIELLSWEPRAYLYHNFATEEEADHIINLAKPHMKKSEVVDSDTGKFKKTLDRTSSGHFLSRGQDEVVQRLEQRIAEWTKLPVVNGEPFHVLHYQEGEQYVEHWDYFHDAVNVQNGGQRVATALLYLSEVDQGGETVFPNSVEKPTEEQAAQLSACGKKGIAVKPRKGDCLLFWNLRPDGSSKELKSLHAGCPVCPDGNPDGRLKCDKWSVTKWIRVQEHKVWN